MIVSALLALAHEPASNPWRLASLLLLILCAGLIVSCIVRTRRRGRDRLIGSLASGVAHDLNNLLTVIRGEVELLQRAESCPIWGDPAVPVYHATDRAAALTRRLADLGRGRDGRRERVDLAGFLQGRHALLRATLGRDSTLSLQLDSTRAPVELDPLELEEVLLNLALNARDAMPQGGNLRIRLHQFARGHVALEVADDGVGMTSELRRRIFARGTSTKGEGHGIGLNHVRRLVHRNGGQISCISRPGAGTTFTLRFPLASNRSTQAPSAALAG